MSVSQIDIWVNALPLAALFVDIQERILVINEAAKNVLGQGLTGRSYITALRQPSVMRAVETCLKDKSEQIAQFQQTEDQSDAAYELRCCYVDASMQGVLITFTDVTEAQKTTQLHRDFVANVSHELRTPLTALMGFIETLQGPASADTAAQQRFLEIMASETARMNRLVDDLLSLSRVEAQERQRPSEMLDLHALLRSVVSTFNTREDTSGFDIALRESPEPTQVIGDSDQLRQVFGNLIENAIKYGGQGVQIQIKVQAPLYDLRLQSNAIRISVKDTGPGFDLIHAVRLTERFYRIDSHRSREMGGTGLGLAIVKHIISRHRGRLEIISAQGQGAEFTVILPVSSQ